MRIDGRKIAAEIIGKLKNKPKPTKFLAAVLVGDDAASLSFIKQKEKTAEELGIIFKNFRHPADVNERVLREEILKLADDKNCGGIIIQLPLPEHINREEIIKAIPSEKDVDNLTGKSSVSSPAVGVVGEILTTYDLRLTTMRVAVVGLGFLVGQPVAAWFRGKCAELYRLDIDDDLKVLKNADLVISGVGKAGLIKPEMLKENAVVIDFGYNFKNGEILGDFNPKSLVINHQSSVSYTPTPGGTGPILVAKLFENFYRITAL